jgi:hypothetical protein
MVKDKLISGLRSWIAPGKEGKVYHQYWIFFRKFFSIISLLLFIFLAVRSIQIGISKGFSGLEDYWHYLANQTQSALSFLKFSNAGHQDEKGFSSAGKTENNSESKGLTGANEEGLRKDEHLKSILGSEKNGSPDSFEIKRKAFNEEEVKAKVRKAKTLLQSGRRNGALLLLNETLLHDLAVRSREKVKVIRSIALAFAAENNPDYTEPDKVRAHPKLYQGITVRWKGRLDRIFREGDGNWLIINHEMKSSQKNGAHFIFLAFIRKTIGDAIIGSQIEVLGEIISTTVTREFSNGLAKSIPIRVMARQLKIIAD